MRKDALTWSLLGPTPACLYHPRSDSHIVYWSGVGMVRSSALIVTCNAWGTMWPSPKMKAAAYSELSRAYMLGAFGDVDWSNYIENNPTASDTYHGSIAKWMLKRNEHLFKELKECYSVQEALAWFSSDNERTIDD